MHNNNYLYIYIHACVLKPVFIYVYKYIDVRIGASSFAPASFAESIPFIGNYFGEEMR
jgi:hypothetical protein